MNRTLLFITALFVLIFMSCQSTKKNNAEMWEQSLFDTLYKVLNDGGILTTYWIPYTVPSEAAT